MPPSCCFCSSSIVCVGDIGPKGDGPNGEDIDLAAGCGAGAGFIYCPNALPTAPMALPKFCATPPKAFPIPLNRPGDAGFGIPGGMGLGTAFLCPDGRALRGSVFQASPC